MNRFFSGGKNFYAVKTGILLTALTYIVFYSALTWIQQSICRNLSRISIVQSVALFPTYYTGQNLVAQDLEQTGMQAGIQ